MPPWVLRIARVRGRRPCDRRRGRAAASGLAV